MLSNRAKRSQFVTCRAVLPRLRGTFETKPICQRGGAWCAPYERGTNRAKRSQFRAVPGGTGPAGRGPSARNKPNLHPWQRIGGASPTRSVGSTAPNKLNSARRGLHRGRNVQNEPNFRQAGIPHHSSIPLFQHSSVPVPSLSCEANPISRLRISDCGLRIVDWGQTSGGAADCAKRTQFPASREPQHSIIPVFHPSLRHGHGAWTVLIMTALFDGCS